MCKSVGIIYVYIWESYACELFWTVWQVTNGQRDNCIFVYQADSGPDDWSFPLSSSWIVWCCEVLSALWLQWFRRWGLHHVSALGFSFLVRLQVCRSRVLWNPLAVLLPSKEGRSGISLALWLNWLEASLLLFISLGLCATPLHSHSCNIFWALVFQKRHSLTLAFHVDVYYVTLYLLLWRLFLCPRRFAFPS